MTPTFPPSRAAAAAVLACALAAGAGCRHLRENNQRMDITPAPVPRELEKVLLPDYRVEPPDILTIEAVRAVPKAPYLVQPLDVLFVQLPATDPNEPPASGTVSVDPDGTVNLGPQYGGPVPVVGLTVTQIQTAIKNQLVGTLKIKDPPVTVSLSQTQATQRISGPHLVRPDGTIALGTYGSVRVAGLTLAEVRRAVEAQLANSLQDPVVSVDVQNYNSKLIYVIFDGAGAGQSIYRLPVTGNDTVLDSLAQVNGLTAVSDVNRVWVARPAPAGGGHTILPVDWRAISECGDTATNYQLMPGDRLFVGAVPLIGLDVRMARAFAPLERFFGLTLLGSATVHSVGNPIGRGFGGGGGFGGFR